MKKSTIVILIIAVLAVGYVWMGYNRFVSLNESIDAQWKQVEVQYQRRFDLIPSLIASVKGATKQEQEIFGAVSDARTRYMNAQGTDEKVRAASAVENQMVKVLAIFEAYPQLQSIQTFRDFMTEQSGTENRVMVERRRFNEKVQGYNVAVKRFPSNLMAKLFGFADRPYFDAAEGSENAPVVNFQN
jgi:LemA protein